MSKIEDPVDLVALTAEAAVRVRELISREPEAHGRALRVAVHDGCCSGYQYALGFDQARDDDYVAVSEGVTVVVDPGSVPYVRGSRIDFVLDLRHSGFRVENPNASSTCRCGQSFEAA